LEDIRYKQRFENFEKSFFLLEQALSINEPSIVEKAGAIQFFEITFELSWKLMKDYLSYIGYEVKSPREAIKTAFSIELINDGSTWLDGLVDRNLTVHTYDEAKADEVYQAINNDYYKLLKASYSTFKALSCTD
jgi:nucleotidyltransferase substrate binding protein (TIGR01987 family)